jgi:ferritin-like metal-binding protein YciE
VQNPQDVFLFDLSLAHAGERSALQILQQGAGEVADERARAVLTRHAQETRAQIRGLEQVFSLFEAQPQALGCPALDGIRQELDLFGSRAPPYSSSPRRPCSPTSRSSTTRPPRTSRPRGS